MAAEYDIPIYQGDDLDQPFWIKDRATGLAINMSTVTTGKVQFRQGPLSTDPLIVQGTVDITQKATGLFFVRLTAAQTAGFPVVGGYYDVELTDAGKVKTWLRGRAVVTAQVTI